MAVGYLADVLRRLLEAATEQQPEPARYTLSGGLTISVRLAADLVGLQLSRAGEPGPSEQEWRTVLRHWPTPLGDVPFDRIVLRGKVYPQAYFPAQPGLPLGTSPRPDKE